jgi:alkylmercury lyase-like protein
VSAIDELQEAAEASPEVTAARSAGFRLLLEEGRPVDRAEWAAAAGTDVEALNTILEGAETKGRVQLDTEGRLIGIAGLTIEPTRHKVEINGTTRWTWCALDAIGILGALEADGIVHSKDPRRGDEVRIAFTDGEPDGDATLFILGGYDGDNTVEEWCPLVNFFSSRQDAEEWVQSEGLKGDIVSVTEIASQAADIWLPVVDPAAPQVS